MSAAQAFLLGITARRWVERDEALVATVHDALLEVLPPSFTPGFTTGNEDHEMPFVIHQPSWLGFYVVFGQRYRLGLSEVERNAFGRASEDREAYDPPGEMPRVEVDVAPFLVSERVLDPIWAARLGLEAAPGGQDPEVVSEALSRLGLRLPSEGELSLCWRLERLGAARDFPKQLWEGLACELPAAVAEQPTPARHTEFPIWIQWGGGAHPIRFPWSVSRRGGFAVRPVMSLLPDEVAWSEAGVAMRAAETPFAWRV